MSIDAFLERVIARMPRLDRSFGFAAWSQSGKSTKEGVGLLEAPGINVEAVVARIMDVDSYRGNIGHVEECRSIVDSAFEPPKSVHFYQRVKIPLVSEIQMELGMHDLGDRDGWRVVAWELLVGPTDQLNPKRGARSEYNDGAWLMKPGHVAYALSSAPRKKDVGRIKFAVLTKGADASASAVLKGNIEGMVRWSKRA